MRADRLVPSEFSNIDLVTALFADAEGDPRATAALRLLTTHRVWLRRTDFLACVNVATEDQHLFADVDWIDASRIGGNYPGSELVILRLAASIASSSVQIPIGDYMAGLDVTNTLRAMTALADAAGHGDLARRLS